MKQSEFMATKKAMAAIAARDRVSVDYVRKQMQLAMLNGLCSTDPQIKAYWSSIPREGEIPTPEELIAYITKIVRGSKP